MHWDGKDLATKQGVGSPRASLVLVGSALLALAGWVGEEAVEPGATRSALTGQATYTASVDRTFDGDGGVVTALAFNSSQEVGRAVAVQGFSIVSAGSALGPNGWSFALARHRADGSLDSSFGLFGHATGAFTNSSPQTGAYALVVQPDGMIVAAGRALWQGRHC